METAWANGLNGDEIAHDMRSLASDVSGIYSRAQILKRAKMQEQANEDKQERADNENR
jgi:hypothetical protein